MSAKVPSNGKHVIVLGILRILENLPECGEQEGALAIESAIRKAIELGKPFAGHSIKRKEAEEFFNEGASHARALEKVLKRPQFRFFTERDVAQFATVNKFSGNDVSVDEFICMVAGFAEICERRSSLINPGKGEYRLSDEYGYPSPKYMVAVFVILFWLRVRGHMPSRSNDAAINMCTKIWECICDASNEPIEEETETWAYQIKTARQGINDIKNRSKLEACWEVKAMSEKPEDREWAARNPVGERPRKTIVSQNAVTLASDILDNAGIGSKTVVTLASKMLGNTRIANG